MSITRRALSIAAISAAAFSIPTQAQAQTDIQWWHSMTAVNGEWVKLVSFMESLQTHRPPFWVRTANITREGASSGAGPQNARLSLQLEAPLAPEKAKP